MKSFQLAAVAFATAAAIGGANARDLTPENKSELANVPATWTDATICYQEGGGIGGPRVVVGIDRGEYRIRSETPGAGLPGYVEKKPGVLDQRELVVPTSLPHWGVGYEDYQSVFVLANGIRLTCDELPRRPAAQADGPSADRSVAISTGKIAKGGVPAVTDVNKIVVNGRRLSKAQFLTRYCRDHVENYTCISVIEALADEQGLNRRTALSTQ